MGVPRTCRRDSGSGIATAIGAEFLQNKTDYSSKGAGYNEARSAALEAMLAFEAALTTELAADDATSQGAEAQHRAISEKDFTMAEERQALAALDQYRTLIMRRMAEDRINGAFAFRAHGAMSAFATPIGNVHGTGIGARRIDEDEYDFDDVVLKTFVFDETAEIDPEVTPSSVDGVDNQVEELPIQLALAHPQRGRHRPVPGGMSISPLGVGFVGTLGCFLARSDATSGARLLLALSNNHVMADTNRLPRGTPIVQPGPETGATQRTDVFAELADYIPIEFPSGRRQPVNEFDAAVALVGDDAEVQLGAMFGGLAYDPTQVATARVGMRVAKVGRTTGDTQGTIVATHVNGVLVNYGTSHAPRIATFENCIQIVGDRGAAFSQPGDSGSVVLEESTGHPVTLLFAGDGRTTTTCDLSRLCAKLGAWPI